MTKYLNFFESESGFTEAVEAGQLFYPNVSYTEDDDTVHWNLARSVKTPMLRMHFITSSPGEEVKLHRNSGAGNAYSGITALEIDGTPVNFSSGGNYSIAEPGNHTAVYQFASPEIPVGLFLRPTDPFTAFTSAEITSAVTSIGYFTFGDCSGLTSVTIPDSVTLIDGVSFSNCIGLTSVTIPDSVTRIAYNAFDGSGLRSVTIPDSVTSLGESCFGHCAQMRSARIGSGITALTHQAFRDCTSLQSVTLPDGLTSIGQGALSGCSSLYDINIPSGVTTIDGKAFSGCTGLAEIYLNPETPPTLGTGALDNTNDCPIYVPAEAVETYKQSWSAYASRIMPMGGGEPDQYSITASVNNEELGQVNLDGETASEGDHVEFDVEVFEMDRYQVSSVSITDGNGNEVECNEDWDNHYSFDMPASDVTISVTIGEKQKHTVTVDSTDGMVGGFEFMSDDGQPSYKEGEYVAFNFNFDGQDGMFQLVSVQAIDCDGNSIEVELEDQGEGRYGCSFEMPGCDVSVFITVEDTRPKYNITASVNDSSLGEVHLDKEALHEGELADIHIDVFNSEANSVTSVTVTDGNGNNVECTKDYWDFSHYYFTMPASDVTVSVEIGDKIPEYNITVALNDDSLGTTRVPKTPLPEGEYGGFNVNLNDEEQYQISSVTVTDGNGNNVEWTTYVNATHTHYYQFKMPASDVTISVVIEPKP